MVEHVIKTVQEKQDWSRRKTKTKTKTTWIHNGQELSKIKEIPNYSFFNIKQNIFKTKNNAPRFVYSQGFPGGLGVKNTPVMQEMEFDSWVGKIPLRRKSQPTSVFLPGKSHRQRSLANYCPWDRKRVWHDLVTEQ